MPAVIKADPEVSLADARLEKKTMAEMSH